MRIIVHVGMAKAGSTTLQTSLARSVDFLRDQGVLYPRPNSDDGHSLLAPIVSGTTEPFLFTKGKYRSTGDFSKASQRFMKSIERQIVKEKPKVLILSSEYLSSTFCYTHASTLKDLLARWSTDIDIVIYLREPRSLYTSSLQQTLKFSSRFTPPDQHTCQYRSFISHYDDVYPGRVNIVLFDFAQFKNNCMVTDFMERFLPDVGCDGLAQNVTKANVSPSCETTWIVRNYREVNFNDRDGETIIQAYYLGLLLDRLASQTNQWNKARLTEAASIEVLAQNHEDLVWLKQEKKLQFRSIDYNKLQSMDLRIRPFKEWRLEDILSVDMDVVRMLESIALHHVISDSTNFRIRQMRWLLGRTRSALVNFMRGS